MDFLSPLLVVVPEEIKDVLDNIMAKDSRAISAISMQPGCINIRHIDGETTITCAPGARMKHTWCEEHATDTIRLTTTSTRLGKKLQKEMFILRDNLTAFDILCEMESIIYGDAFVSKVSVNKSCENHYASI